MVYKVSQGEVRSGNTLRGFRSYRNGRYTRQACIVSRSNLKPSEVPIFLDSCIENKSIVSNLQTTDVALSLNKKKRWLLPATVGHMIKTGSFKEAKPIVSLLERHKLKRRANCVSFICNQGRIRHVTPKRTQYFGFNLNTSVQTHSNKKNKHAKLILKKSAKPVTTKSTTNESVKTVEVFTVAGSGKAADVKKMLVSSKPEYQLEVFYPCPQTCSLTYNPKYTNVHLDFGEEGAMELKSEKKVVKKGRRYKKRMVLDEWGIFDPKEIFVDDEEFWNDGSEDFEIKAAFNSENREDEYSFESDLISEIESGTNLNDYSYHKSENENIIACLIAQAEKGKSLCEIRPRNRKKSRKKFDTNINELNNHKTHIVHAKKNNLAEDTQTSIMSTLTRNNHEIFQSSRIILKYAETTPQNLIAKFGRFYAEAESEPRRFLIDVTLDIQNLLCPYRDAEQSVVYVTFLVFVHDGVYDQNLDVYKVIFNSNSCTKSQTFNNYLSFKETSIDEIMNQVASFVLDMKEENLLEYNTDQSCEVASIPLLKFVKGPFEISVRNSFDEMTNMLNKTRDVEKNVHSPNFLDSVITNLDFDIFCDICYENINPTQSLRVYGTNLLRCSHIFCDDCWRPHLRSKLKDRSENMTCPGYDCDQLVDPVTMLSLLHVSEVSEFYQRKFEDEVELSSYSKLCPNQKCGRVVKLDCNKLGSDMSIDVTCSCGHHFCFSCLLRPHWPATCKQAQKYNRNLNALESQTEKQNHEDTFPEISSTLETNKEDTMEYIGRICPKCSTFIEKEFGCRHMSCYCGHEFCWDCLSVWRGAHFLCFPHEGIVNRFTMKVKVRHLVMPQIFSLYTECKSKPKSILSSRKKSFYKKALQRRNDMYNYKYQNEMKEIVKKIERDSHKDLLLKKEILTICGMKITDSTCLTYIQTVPYAIGFLRSCCELNRVLLHVAEFTFVLLQDAPDSVDRRRAVRLANDMSGYSCFIKSILEVGQKQDMRSAVKRLADIQVTTATKESYFPAMESKHYVISTVGLLLHCYSKDGLK